MTFANLQIRLTKLYKIVFSLKAQDEDIRRREFILNLIIIGTLLLVAWSNIIILCSTIVGKSEENYIDLIPFTLLTLSFVGLYIISRLGEIKVASYILIILYLSGIIYGTARWGVTLPAVILSYALLITITAILISSRAGLIMVGISIIAIVGFGYEEVVLKIIPDWRIEKITFFDIAEYSVILIIIGLISWLSSKEIEKSLKRARQSEKELRAERDSLEITIAERTKELEQAQAEKVSQLYRFAEFGRLSSGLFHDIINPLTALNLNVTAINNSIHPDVAIVKENLTHALLASKRMETLISTITKQIRPEDSNTKFSVKTVVEELLILFSHRSKLLHLTITYKIPENIYIVGNPFKFQQVITNLLSNSFDSYENYHEAIKKEVIVEAQKENNNIYIIVTDYGSGISTEILPKIFNSFFSTKPTTKGMGLGLSMMKSIIKSDFNGEIQAQSNKAQGTIFTITIPDNTHEY